MTDPVISPDGKSMWTGSEWIPAPPTPTAQSANVSMQDSVITGDVTISQNIKDGGKECPDCKSTNVKVMICNESDCSKKFCELCDSHCRWEYPDQLFTYNSGMGAGPYCSTCILSKIENAYDEIKHEVEFEKKKKQAIHNSAAIGIKIQLMMGNDVALGGAHIFDDEDTHWTNLSKLMAGRDETDKYSDQKTWGGTNPMRRKNEGECHCDISGTVSKLTFEYVEIKYYEERKWRKPVMLFERKNREPRKQIKRKFPWTDVSLAGNMWPNELPDNSIVGEWHDPEEFGYGRLPIPSDLIACADENGIWIGNIVKYHDSDFQLTVKRDDDNQEYVVGFEDLYRDDSFDYHVWGWGDPRRLNPDLLEPQ